MRVLPTLLYKNFGLVKGVNFDSLRAVGSPMQAIKVYNMRGVDELAICDVVATREGRRPDFALIDELADECFMPLAVGGGIRSLDDIGQLLAVGADKVIIGSAAAEVSGLVSSGARAFGSQCIVVALDTRRNDAGVKVMIRSGTVPHEQDVTTYAQHVEEEGAGEILLTSIDRDGTLSGYDTQTITEVSDAVSIPVIASGGCGRPGDTVEAVRSGASAVAAASMFHFTQFTPLEVKLSLNESGYRVRIEQ